MEKNLKEQIKYLEGKLDKNENSVLFARLADAYLQMDRVDDAIQLCEKGIRKHPYYVTGHYVLGKCYLKKKLFDQAEKEFKRVLLFDSKYIAAHRDYGELMAQIGWNNTCEMSYEEIIRIDPFNERAKQRLQGLKEQLALTRDEKREEQPEMELEEVEENILTQVSPAMEEDLIAVEEPVLEEPALEEPPKQEVMEPAPAAPPIARELFNEGDTVIEDDKVNLDLLEDIFRDDMPLDLSLDEEFEANIEGEPSIVKKERHDVREPNYFFGGESLIEEKQDIEEFEGLDEDDLFALIKEDTQPIKSEFKSPADTPKPEPRTEDRSQFNPAIDRMSTELHRKDEPKHESLADTTPPEPKEEKEPIQVQEEEITKTDDLMKKKEKIVTPTLGEIYAAQHQYAKAIGVYELLRKKDPDNDLYIQKIEYLQQKLEESQSEG